MKQLRELYRRYRDYIRVDLLLYLLMFGGVILFMLLAVIFKWI